jgi:hypothetical protein
MKIELALPLALFLSAAAPAVAQVPPFTAEEIASTPGSTAFDNAVGRWTIEAEGADIWNSADQFRFTHIALNGDAEVVARVVALGPVTGTAYDPWAKAGVMIRQSVAAGSPHAFMPVTGNNGASFQYRQTADGASGLTASTGGAFVPNRWVRLVRAGDSFTGFWSDDPAAGWNPVGGAVTVAMTNPVRVGLALTSHSDGAYVRGVFDRLRITENGVVIYEWRPPAPANLDATGAPYQIDVTWDAVPGAQSYTLERAEGAGAYEEIAAGLTATSYADVDVTVGLTYSYRVRSVVNGAASLPSNVDSAVATIPPPRTEGHDEGLFDDRCACGSTAFPATSGAILAAALLALAARRRGR